MEKIKNFIPNLLTLGNLLFGCLAIYFLFEHFADTNYSNPSIPIQEQTFKFNAIYCLFISLALDFLDGFVARLLHANSEIGKQLDSIADVVSFGVAPGFMLFLIMPEAIQFIAFLLPLAAAYRLAKFNIDTEQSTYFKGLATPAMTLFVIGLNVYYTDFDGHQLINVQFLPVIIVLLAFLLISNIPLFSLKVKSLHLNENWYRYLLILFSVISFIWLQYKAFILIIPFYILLSLLVKKQFKPT